MQFNENGEELGEIGMKVLNEMMFGQVVKNPAQATDDGVTRKPLDDEKAKQKEMNALVVKWDQARAALDSIKEYIFNVNGPEYATRVEAAIKALSELVDNAVIMKNPANVSPASPKA